MYEYNNNLLVNYWNIINTIDNEIHFMIQFRNQW